jgi:hypothetical protein
MKDFIFRYAQDLLAVRPGLRAFAIDYAADT